MWPLLASAISLSLLHSLAPDHWAPFVALARSSNWSRWKLCWVSFLAGLGHVGSSLMIGLAGIFLGLGVSRIQQTETYRGSVAVWLLIGFGVAYVLWGLKHARHPHPHLELKDALQAAALRRVWMMFVVVIFGPCEPLVPLLFLAYHQGWMAVGLISFIFSLVTIAMIVGQSLLSYMGLELMRGEWVERYAHALAGGVIVLTGIFVLLAG